MTAEGVTLNSKRNYFQLVSHKERVAVMGFIAFIVSIIVTGAVSSLFSVESGSSRANQPDYHFVPFAGDAFGA